MSRDNSPHLWYCRHCDILAATAVKTDNHIETKCRQYNQELKQELQLKFKDIDSKFSHSQSQIRKELEKMQLQMGSSQVNNKGVEMEKKMVEHLRAHTHTRQIEENIWLVLELYILGASSER